MKINYQDLGALNDNGVPAINQAIVIPAKDALRQLRTLVTGNLTIRDNAYAAIVSFSVTHGTEYAFQNPLKTTPIGFTPIMSSLTGTTALPVQSAFLNTTRTDGLLGLTLRFTLPFGETIEVVRTSTQSIANATETSIQWSGICTPNSLDPSGVFSWSSGANTIVTINKPGLFLINAHVGWAASATGGRGAYIQKNNARISANSEIMAAASGLQTQHEIVKESEAVANDTFRLRATQVSGGALNAQGDGALTDEGTDRCSFTITRVRNDESYTANVTGILWGG